MLTRYVFFECCNPPSGFSSDMPGIVLFYIVKRISLIPSMMNIFTIECAFHTVPPVPSYCAMYLSYCTPRTVPSHYVPFILYPPYRPIALCAFHTVPPVYRPIALCTCTYPTLYRTWFDPTTIALLLDFVK